MTLPRKGRTALLLVILALAMLCLLAGWLWHQSDHGGGSRAQRRQTADRSGEVSEAESETRPNGRDSDGAEGSGPTLREEVLDSGKDGEFHRRVVVSGPPRNTESESPPEEETRPDWIRGRVVFDDGSPAADIVVHYRKGRDASGKKGPVRTIVSDSTGAFSGPAVPGAQYRLWVDRRHNWRRATKAMSVRAGGADVLIEITRSAVLVLKLRDEKTQCPVPASGYKVSYPGFSHWRGIKGKDQLHIPLPPVSAVGNAAEVRVAVRAKGYEEGTVIVPRERLGLPPGEQLLGLRCLPKTGWLLQVQARLPSGVPYRGRIHLLLNRGGEVVQQLDTMVDDGRCSFGRLVLKFDDAYLLIEKQRFPVRVPAPVEGDKHILDVTVGAHWELTIDPVFEGRHRRLTLRMPTGRGSVVSQTWARWPVVRRGLDGGTWEVRLSDGRGIIWSQSVSLLPGQTATLRPFVPADRGVTD